MYSYILYALQVALRIKLKSDHVIVFKLGLFFTLLKRKIWVKISTYKLAYGSPGSSIILSCFSSRFLTLGGKYVVSESVFPIASRISLFFSR